MTNHPNETMSGGMDGGAMNGSGGLAPGSMVMVGMMDCYGGPIPERQGNPQGHIFPGSIFLLWATHWMISATWRYLVATRAGRTFRSSTTEGLLVMVPALEGFNRYPVESVLKAVGGMLLFILQITYGSYKNLVCQDGPRVGRLVTQHLNSWSHASMNLGFSLSGFVELLGMSTQLPVGVPQAVLSLSFLIEAMLFSLHEKNGHLDQTDHYLLAQCCWAGAVFAALEAAFPESFMLLLGRAGAMLMQGCWFIQSAVVLFSGKPYWSDQYAGHEDEAPAMFLPLVFSYYLLLVAIYMLAIYAVLEAIHKRMFPHQLVGGPEAHQNGSELAVYETSRLLSSEDDGHEGGLKSIPLGTLPVSRRI